MEMTVTGLPVDTFRFSQRTLSGEVALQGKTGWDKEQCKYWAQIEGQERRYAENLMQAALNALTEWYYPRRR